MKLIAHNLTKAYHHIHLFDGLNLELESGQTYCLMGPSGSGKTTLLRILLGLEQPDSGTVTRPDGGDLTAVFQENRLCERFSPLENVRMVLDKSRSSPSVVAEMAAILPNECLTRPVSTLSGGMKRRTAICRAVLAPSDGILMDEPFTGLDEATKMAVISYIKKRTADKLLLVSTHQTQDVQLLAGQLIFLG